MALVPFGAVAMNNNKYNKSEKQNSGSKIEELLSFITHALAAREKTQSINKTNKSCIELRNRRMEFKSQDGENKRINQKGISTATANELLVTPLNENRNKTKNSCVFCESMTHTTNSCGRAMTDLSLQERKNILLRKGLDHKFLCFRQQHIERKNLVQTESTDLGNQSEGEVFLQTLVVYIKNGNCERLVRAILDTGSQKSYVSQYIAKTLGANRRETFLISLDRKTSLIEPTDGLPLPSKESDRGTDMEPMMDSSPLLPNQTSHPVFPDGTEHLEPRRSRYGRLLRPVQRL
ncbi:hypothetical protein HNY73_011284 [Argiope bruennichi]|uniref:Peptidase aspartic putative domain-containing protein n=1 Tax=Argiope bruennichi TaxID=94029 RepID=A0A8T0F8N0_ARGBR|nr:hypothetical protein HNY73_011284 [Argiope bruennichi]